MEKFKKEMLNTLSVQEVKNVYGGYAPPTEDQLERLDPWWRDIVCW